MLICVICALGGNTVLWLIGAWTVPEAAFKAGIVATHAQIQLMNDGFFNWPRFFCFLTAILLAKILRGAT